MSFGMQPNSLAGMTSIRSKSGVNTAHSTSVSTQDLEESSFGERAYCIFCFPCWAIGKCMGESSSKRESLEWIDAMKHDLEDFTEEFGQGWSVSLQAKLKTLRKHQLTRTNQWIESYNEMLEKYKKESQLMRRDPNSVKLRTSSKLISKQLQENLEMVSGQNFLLLSNQDFLLKLKAIKLHLESPINPINQIIKRFVELFIEQHRLLLYKVDYDGSDFMTAIKIESFEQMK